MRTALLLLIFSMLLLCGCGKKVEEVSAETSLSYLAEDLEEALGEVETEDILLGEEGLLSEDTLSEEEAHLLEEDDLHDLSEDSLLSSGEETTEETTADAEAGTAAETAAETAEETTDASTAESFDAYASLLNGLAEAASDAANITYQWLLIEIATDYGDAQKLEYIGISEAQYDELYAYALANGYEESLRTSLLEFIYAQDGETVIVTDLLDLVNADRANNGAGALVWSAELEAYCLSRIDTIMENYSQNLWIHTGYTRQENILVASAVLNAEIANQAWIDSDVHHQARITEGFSAYAAVFYCENGIWYCIEAFS